MKFFEEFAAIVFALTITVMASNAWSNDIVEPDVTEYYIDDSIVDTAPDSITTDIPADHMDMGDYDALDAIDDMHSVLYMNDEEDHNHSGMDSGMMTNQHPVLLKTLTIECDLDTYVKADVKVTVNEYEKELNVSGYCPLSLPDVELGRQEPTPENEMGKAKIEVTIVDKNKSGTGEMEYNVPNEMHSMSDDHVIEYSDFTVSAN